jgi:hypothetical protein
MSQCWSEGEWRAFGDRELPPGDMERAAAHLQACPACEALHRRVMRRAAAVSGLLEELPASAPAPAMPVIPRPAPSSGRLRLALAIAAGLLVASFALGPWRRVRVAPPAPPVAQRPPAAGIPQWTPAVRPIPPAVPIRKRAPATRMARSPRPANPNVRYFMALDDEPFVMGMIVRVGLGPTETPADVIFGTDGRPRAIRLVSDFTTQGERR